MWKNEEAKCVVDLNQSINNIKRVGGKQTYSL